MANSGGYNVGVLGATGMVGRLLLEILVERAFPLKDLRLFASANSQGKKVPFGGQAYTVEETTEDSFEGLDILFASAATGANRHFSPIAARAGATVVDDSAAFRMDPDVPLVIAGVNDDDLLQHNGIIAGPNCSTIQLVLAINPIHQVNPICRMVVDTYQAVSGWGRDAMVELDDQIKAKAAGTGAELPRQIFRHEILGNVLPEVDSFPRRWVHQRGMESHPRDSQDHARAGDDDFVHCGAGSRGRRPLRGRAFGAHPTHDRRRCPRGARRRAGRARGG